MNEPILTSPQEHWLPITGYEGAYEVSDFGRVRSLDRYVMDGKSQRLHHGYILTAQATRRGGHLEINLYRYGTRATFYVHALVLTAFVGPRPEGLVCRHLDGDVNNNRPDNLVWGTMSENKRDQIRHGTDANARKTHCAKGHPYDEVNTAYVSDGRGRGRRRACRICWRQASRELRLRHLSA